MTTNDPVQEVRVSLAHLVAEGRLSRNQARHFESTLNRALETAARRHSALAAFVDGVLMALDARALVEGTHFARLPVGTLALAVRDTWTVVSRSMASQEQRSSARLFLRESAAKRLGVVGYQARSRFGGRRRRVLLLDVAVARQALRRPVVPV